MKKILSLVKYVLLAISVVTLIFVFLKGEDGVVPMLNWAYVLLGIAIVVTLVFPLLNIAQNPKGAMRSLIGLAIVVVVLGVAYAMASTEPMLLSDGTVESGTGALKVSDTGLITTYIALAGAILVVVFGEIRNSFK